MPPWCAHRARSCSSTCPSLATSRPAAPRGPQWACPRVQVAQLMGAFCRSGLERWRRRGSPGGRPGKILVCRWAPPVVPGSGVHSTTARRRARPEVRCRLCRRPRRRCRLTGLHPAAAPRGQRGSKEGKEEGIWGQRAARGRGCAGARGRPAGTRSRADQAVVPTSIAPVCARASRTAVARPACRRPLHHLVGELPRYACHRPQAAGRRFVLGRTRHREPVTPRVRHLTRASA